MRVIAGHGDRADTQEILVAAQVNLIKGLNEEIDDCINPFQKTGQAVARASS